MTEVESLVMEDALNKKGMTEMLLLLPALALLIVLHYQTESDSSSSTSKLVKKLTLPRRLL